ncbi:MAG: 6-carboxytetrahydropterin synthase [Chloroflexi bacterium]|nr:MAG: 6-carboxytetrahydropterin synthase [Chloroflexota bacterium]
METMARVTRKEHFSAAHRLFDPALDDAQNFARFGPCSNPGGHGHNYRLEVTVEGPIDPSTGMVLDLRRLHEAVQELVLDKVDHRHLNSEVDFLRGVIPTTENLARCIYQQLEARLPAGRLVRVRIDETDRNSAEYGRSDG